MTEVARDYLMLIHQFLNGTIAPADFEDRYLTMFKQESRELDETTYQILDRLFADVDRFCGSADEYEALSDERPGWYLNMDGLTAAARAAADALREATLE